MMGGRKEDLYGSLYPFTGSMRTNRLDRPENRLHPSDTQHKLEGSSRVRHMAVDRLSCSVRGSTDSCAAGDSGDLLNPSDPARMAPKGDGFRARQDLDVGSADSGVKQSASPADMGRMTPDRRQVALERFQAATELPLLVLAVAMVPLLILPLLVGLPDRVQATLTAVDWFIWAVFAFEYVIRLYLSADRWRYVRREWPNLLIVALPFLRPLRVVRSARALRILRLSRLVAFTGKIGQEAKRLLVRHKLHYALLFTMVVVVGAAGFVLMLEEGHGGTINSFGDALWWAITTVTTVGYGDVSPVTPAGRGVAAGLMVAGITLFGLLTANIAAFMIEKDEPAEEATDDRLDEVLRQLTELQARLSRQGGAHCAACGALQAETSAA
jgi:voltage-gated potassium channel